MASHVSSSRFLFCPIDLQCTLPMTSGDCSCKDVITNIYIAPSPALASAGGRSEARLKLLFTLAVLALLYALSFQSNHRNEASGMRFGLKSASVCRKTALSSKRDTGDTDTLEARATGDRHHQETTSQQTE